MQKSIQPISKWGHPVKYLDNFSFKVLIAVLQQQKQFTVECSNIPLIKLVKNGIKKNVLTLNLFST